MSQTATNSGSSKTSSKPLNVALIIVTVLSLAFAGYTTFNPRVTTITQQHFVTNTSTFVSIGTQTVASVTTVIYTSLPAGWYCYTPYNCGPYVTPPGYYFGCYQSPPYITANGNIVQCSGYLYTDGNGCVDLVVRTDNGLSNNILQYYYLQNLPVSHPPIGSWVTVTGIIIQQGNNMGPNGACPTSSINVISIR